ncbi:transglycosylase SLT domain-containing protein [Hansschlegelia sp. KR7-227]|jgi:soluble lytic murein transglycosylase-like protein|uniref:transglycosylase SLT domain-containing protein n=1 Tax=Hansschlegelia sp. KR7-227 TaxID=3400914 RepID=UPI003C06BF15
MRPTVFAALVALLATNGPLSAETAPEAAPAATAPAVPAPGPEAPSPDLPGTDAAEAAPAADLDETGLRAIVRKEALGAGLPPEVAEAVAEVESGFNPKSVGGVGEIGLMQVLPSTARMLGFRAPLKELFEPETNARYGVRYLSDAWRMTGEDICATVMKYRAGHGETRYSHRSVAYCLRVRKLLADRGFKVTGAVPVATFGAPATAGSGGRGARRLANGRIRMRFNWRQVDLRRRSLDRAAAASLNLMQ